VGASYRDLDADFRWAVGVATFAEILKHSPYASTAELPAVGEVIAADPGSANGDKSEFSTLFSASERLLGVGD
jgi:hypothetical protein